MSDGNAIATLPAPVCAWENEGGAPRGGPTVAAGAEAPDGSPASHPLATLGAVLAVWPDLSPAVRMRVAGAVVAALRGDPLPALAAH